MISLYEVLWIHEELIRRFGGIQGIRDESALKSALSRPFSGYQENEFYPTPQEKASAIPESILNNHPFLDAIKGPDIP